ncbi:hypothetical protein HQ447_00310 [bacterium]|nr:hypothetical protein [bacterium]
MAFQLVYTSAAKLLDAGRSGYGTVARSKSLTPLVVSTIERVSQFANLRGLDRSRVIFVHRRITAGSNRFHILTRIVDAGADYTGRTNHLAHHLVVSQQEAAQAAALGITPADILGQFPWLDRWDGSARFLEAAEDVPLEPFRAAGRDAAGKSWAAITGNRAHSRLLSGDTAPRAAVLILPETADTLQVVAEALAGFGPQSWSRSFTTSLETTDELYELEWIVTHPAAYREIQPRCGSRARFDLTRPETLPIPPTPEIAPPATLLGAPPKVPDEPISVQVVEKSSRKTAATPLPDTAPGTASKTPLLLAGACVTLLAAAGILYVAVLRKPAPPSAATTAAVPTTTLSADQEKAVAELKHIHLTDKTATAIVTAGAGWQQWQRFILDSNRSLLKLSTVGRSDFTLPKPPSGDDPPNLMPWAVDLRELITNLATLDQAAGERQWLERFKLACRQIANLKVDGSMPQIAGNSDEFEKSLFHHLAGRRLDILLKNPEADGFAELLSERDPWQTRKFPERRELILAKFKTVVGQPDSRSKLEALLRQVEAHDAFFGPDAAGLQRSLEASLAMTGSPQPAQHSAADHAWAAVPERQLILVSENDLQRGIPVELLKAILPTQPGDTTINLQGLTLRADGSLTEFGKLTRVGDYFSKTWEGTSAERFFADGRFALTQDGVKRVDLGYRGKSAVILADVPTPEVIDDSLGFDFEILDENQAQIGGSLVRRIRELTPLAVRDSLKISLAPESSLRVTQAVDGSWTVSRLPTKKARSGGLSDRDQESITYLLGIYREAAAATGTTQQSKSANAEAERTALKNLKTQLVKSLGADPLERLLAEQNLSWKDLEARNSGFVLQALQTLMLQTRKSEDPRPLDEELRKITSLTIQTRAGRMLFKASRTP